MSITVICWWFLFSKFKIGHTFLEIYTLFSNRRILLQVVSWLHIYLILISIWKYPILYRALSFSIWNVTWQNISFCSFALDSDDARQSQEVQIKDKCCRQTTATCGRAEMWYSTTRARGIKRRYWKTKGWFRKNSW